MTTPRFVIEDYAAGWKKENNRIDKIIHAVFYVVSFAAITAVVVFSILGPCDVC